MSAMKKHFAALRLPLPPPRRMAEECGSLERQLREAREARDAQHRVNAELAAELQRMAAESALGPVLALDKDGRVRMGRGVKELGSRDVRNGCRLAADAGQRRCVCV